ncbi:MAG TPA: NTF2 fold immunity protein [Candidatus Cybelea sp.]|nr:NTF2 fold immunity protein [Candidatus Cybelea sp.]
MPNLPPLHKLDGWPPDAPKSDESALCLVHMARGGVVFSADTARSISETLIEAHYGKDELVRQLPLTVTDTGDCFRVEGSFNHDQAMAGPGAFFLTLWKHDGRAVNFGRWEVVPPRDTK